MSKKLVFSLKILMWLVMFVVGVVIVRYAGELIFYYPGLLAKKISLMLTGSSKGVVTSFLFYLVAAGIALIGAGLAWGMISLDRWLDDQRRTKP